MNDTGATPSGPRFERHSMRHLCACLCMHLVALPLFAAPLFAAALFAYAASVTAQIPGLPSLTGDAKGPETKAAAPAETPEQAKARVAEQFDAARE